MTTEIWDKKSAINGITADRVLQDSFFANSRVLFIAKEGNRVTRIESIDVIKNNNGLDGMTDEQVMQWYVTENLRVE